MNGTHGDTNEVKRRSEAAQTNAQNYNFVANNSALGNDNR